MYIDYEIQAGAYHTLRKQECQDYIAFRKEAQRITVVMCDGAGGLKQGGTAARIISVAVADFFHEKGEFFQRCPADYIRQEVIQLINNRIIQAANEYGTEVEEFGCTLIAVSLEAGGRFVALNLGDGRILMKEKEDYFYAVSSPMNGLFKNETYLTMNCDMNRYLRVIHCQKKAEQVLLWTDGADNKLREQLGEVSHGIYLLKQKCKGREILDSFRSLLKGAEDDYTVCYLDTGSFKVV